MLHANFLFKGMLIGFALAAPLGPVGLLCIRRVMEHGRFSGIFSGLGAALGDAFYGFFAAFGVTLISDFFVQEAFWLRLVGGMFLCLIGLKLFFSKPPSLSSHGHEQNFFTDFASTLLLTLSNPMTALLYIFVFASFGLGGKNYGVFHALSLVLGVFLGSFSWWTLVSEGVTFCRKSLKKPAVIWIQKGAAIALFAFGVGAFVSIGLSR